MAYDKQFRFNIDLMYIVPILGPLNLGWERQFLGIHPVAVSISYVYSDRTEVTQIIPPSPSSHQPAWDPPADPPRCPTMHICPSLLLNQANKDCQYCTKEYQKVIAKSTEKNPKGTEK